MNQYKLGTSKSLQSSITLERCYRSNTPTNTSNSRNSFFKGDQSHTLNMTSNLNKNKKLKHKQKVKWRNGNKERMFIDGPYQQNIEPERKRRSVKYIPETIKFRSQSKTRVSGIFQKASKNKKLEKSCLSNKQNQMALGNSVVGIQKLVMNRELLKCSLKPSRINFMSRVSNIYDLLVSKTNLPQFIQYFLGEALFIIRKDSRISIGNEQKNYDWKLEEFKKICEGIYENSEEEDLKHFMSLCLPSISRWSSKYSFGHATVNIKSVIAQQEQFGCAGNKNFNQERITYFKSLNKKESHSGVSQKQNIDLIEKLNMKLDRYINSMKSSSIGPDKFEDFKEFADKARNASEDRRWRKRKSLEQMI